MLTNIVLMKEILRIELYIKLSILKSNGRFTNPKNKFLNFLLIFNNENDERQYCLID